MKNTVDSLIITEQKVYLVAVQEYLRTKEKDQEESSLADPKIFFKKKENEVFENALPNLF